MSEHKVLDGDGDVRCVLSCLVKNGEPRITPAAASELGLNPSQCEAYISALSKELSIIQGMPKYSYLFTLRF